MTSTWSATSSSARCWTSATYNQPDGGPFASGPLAWLQWQLKGDAKARALFVGENCGYCDGETWKIRRHLLE